MITMICSKKQIHKKYDFKKMLFCYDDFYFSLIFIIGVWFDRYCSFLSVHVSDDFIFLYGFNKYIFEICLLDLS